MRSRDVDVNGIRLRITEAGEGPVVLLLHGFLNLGWSWRAQLAALADAGYHAVAPDLRGYGGSDAPEGVDAYTSLDLVGDVVGLIGELGDPAPVVVGHDWGAMIAWQTALLRPDLVRGVAGVSVPYVPRGDLSLLAAMRAKFGDGYYMNYFQQPGVADAELARDVASALRGIYFQGSGSAERIWDPVIPAGGGWLGQLPDPGHLPPWLSAEDFAPYVEAFERTGFTGALNWYRAIDRSWRLLAPWHGVPVRVPAFFVYGEDDAFANYAAPLIAGMAQTVPDLRGVVGIPGCGHWVQQETPDELSEALLRFLGEL